MRKERITPRGDRGKAGARLFKSRDARESAVAGAAGKPRAGRHVSLAYSPCPNDTFMFFHIARKRLSPPGVRFATHLRDIETLNRMSLDGVFDVSKVSFHTYLRIRGAYRLLNSGAALGYGCGPVVVSRERRTPNSLAGCAIAVPGELTTGHLLLRLWMPAADTIRFAKYDRILPLLREGVIDAGVIIHESRFVYEQAGMHLVKDLGRWWEEETGLPIPLGGIVAHRRLGDNLINAIDAAIRTSILQARHAPEDTMPYVRRLAQEVEDDVLRLHIRTFVNEFSMDLGETGRQAVARLETMARKSGIVQ